MNSELDLYNYLYSHYPKIYHALIEFEKMAENQNKDVKRSSLIEVYYDKD